MRNLRWTALLAAVALTATACGGGDSGAEDGPVTLRFSWWGSDTRHTMTQELIDAFQAEHPNIKVAGEFTGWGDYWDKLATSTAGGNSPDVMQHDLRYVREYADRKALLDLSKHDVDISKLDPAVVDTGKVGDATYAIPTGVNAYTVVVNTDLYQQAGVPIPDDTTWSWADFIDTTAEITAKSDGVYGIQNIGFNDAGLEIFARQRGETIFTADGGLGVSDQTLTDWFTLMLQSRDRKSEPEPSLTIEAQAGGIDQSLMATKRGATGVWWTNELATLTKASGSELKLLRFPGESQGTQPGMFLKPAMFFAASARTEHPEEAATFIDWLINSPNAAEIQLSDRGLPANTELREQIFDKLKAADQQSGEFLRAIGPTLAPPPVLPPPGAGEVQGIFQQLNEQILFDRLGVPEAVQQFRSQAEAALS